MTEKEVGTYKGDFKTAIRSYAFERMGRDPDYRDAVHKAVEERRKQEAAAKSAQER